MTPGSVTKIVSFKVGQNTIYYPVTVNVIDFYYATQFDVNVTDTLFLRKGTNFLLEIGCKDTSGNFVSANKIRAIRFAYDTGIIYGIAGFADKPKIFWQADYSDTTNFSFLISAFPNITPSAEDTGRYFQFNVSNKELKVPIKLLY